MYGTISTIQELIGRKNWGFKAFPRWTNHTERFSAYLCDLKLLYDNIKILFNFINCREKLIFCNERVVGSQFTYSF